MKEVEDYVFLHSKQCDAKQGDNHQLDGAHFAQQGAVGDQRGGNAEVSVDQTVGEKRKIPTTEKGQSELKFWQSNNRIWIFTVHDRAMTGMLCLKDATKRFWYGESCDERTFVNETSFDAFCRSWFLSGLKMGLFSLLTDMTHLSTYLHLSSLNVSLKDLPFYSNGDLSGGGVQRVEPALHEKSPLQTKGTDQEVEAHTAEAVAFQEGHEETESNKDHDVDILEAWREEDGHTLFNERGGGV